MDKPSPGTTAKVLRLLGVCASALLLVVVMTWPLASGLGHLGRTEASGDARFAVWNVAWVAHALSTDPTRVYDANIFHPHGNTLAFSEANLGAGVVALPAWLITRNPFTAFNVVVLLSFAATVVATFYLARLLTSDTAGAWTAAVIFAFCPYLFSHTAHIQLLMPWGIPLAMIAMHRLVDAPSLKRGAVLGLVLAVQALSCAYYGIFAGLMVGLATLFYAWSRRLWSSSRYWVSVAAAAAIAVGVVLPFFVPYLEIQRETGFARSLDDARSYAANWRSYLASSAHAHRWMLPALREMGGWNGEPLFPGFVALGLAGYGTAALLLRPHPAHAAAGLRRDRETVALYGVIAVLAFWTSLGPAAGLYTLLYQLLPVFSFLRAPSRTGIVVMLSAALLAAYGVRALRQGWPGRRARIVGGLAVLAALVDLAHLPFDWRPADPFPRGYRVLAARPRGAVVEFPFYDRRIDYHIHTRYMLNSTTHWQPLVNGYSDHTPADFASAAARLASFPSHAAFATMREKRVRYVTVHRDRYGAPAAEDVLQRLEQYRPYLRLLVDDGRMLLYEVTGYPQ